MIRTTLFAAVTMLLLAGASYATTSASGGHAACRLVMRAVGLPASGDCSVLPILAPAQGALSMPAIS